MNQKHPQTETLATYRPLYIRRVPEEVWNRVHINAIRSRLRLSTYLVRLMEQSEPIRSKSIDALDSTEM
jgi:hypothetical protein